MEPDNFLVTQIQIDDIKAFKQFFESFYPSVCVFAQKYLKDAALAEDLAQEALIEFWKIKENFMDLKAIKGFIYTVTKNKCLNHIKLRKIRENLLQIANISDEYFYELILEEETYSIVHQAVNQLAPQSRKIVWLSMEGSKNQEIANRLNVTINTVKTLKKNAYKELRNQLKDQILVMALLGLLLN
jgi:RNA polymerase sigma-70 factor (ECF subfamily)